MFPLDDGRRDMEPLDSVSLADAGYSQDLKIYFITGDVELTKRNSSRERTVPRIGIVAHRRQEECDDRTCADAR